MKIEDFEKLMKDADKDVEMPDSYEGIIKKNNLLPGIIQKWIKLYQDQQYVYSNLKVELAELYGDLYKCFKLPKHTKELQSKYNFVVNEFWDNAKAIESQINVVPAYIKKMKQVNQQKYILDFIEKTLKNMENLGYVIKNYIDYKKTMMAVS